MIIETFNNDSEHHSFYGRPSSVYSVGAKIWEEEDTWHREDGLPAAMRTARSKDWVFENHVHNSYGPCLVNDLMFHHCLYSIESLLSEDFFYQGSPSTRFPAKGVLSNWQGFEYD